MAKMYKPKGTTAVKKIPTVDLLYHLRERLLKEKRGDELLDVSLTLSVIAKLSLRIRKEQYQDKDNYVY